LQTEFENTENKQIMYAIVDIAGQQFKVEKDQKLFVHRLDGDAGSEVSFDRVLLIENEGKITIGDPVIKDAAISAKVVEHVKGDKVLVFKKKRRKGYRKLNGHRQYLTRIEITEISEKGAKKPAAKATEEKKETVAEKATSTQAAPKAAAEKKVPSAKAPFAKKSTATKSETAAKKPAAPKAESAAKKPAAKKTATPKTETAAKKPAAKKPAAKKTDSGDKAADKK
jgi:large subunit ribosomal protein L21